jgi:hypothetical protein
MDIAADSASAAIASRAPNVDDLLDIGEDAIDGVETAMRS